MNGQHTNMREGGDLNLKAISCEFIIGALERASLLVPAHVTPAEYTDRRRGPRNNALSFILFGLLMVNT